MKKFFTLPLWPTEEMRKKKQHTAAQQAAAAGGNVVVDGVDGAEEGRRMFGIRNYLHQFYFLSSPVVEEIIDGSGTYGGKSSGAWYVIGVTFVEMWNPLTPGTSSRHRPHSAPASTSAG